MYTSNPSSRFMVVFVLQAATAYSTTLAAPTEFVEWVEGQLFPSEGNDLAGEILSYILPYGALGFTSHLLTYYTVLALCFGRQPLLPWQKLKHSWLDLILGALGFLVAVPLAAFSMSACRHRCEFLLIATWKLVTSLSLNFITIRQAMRLRRGHGYTRPSDHEKPVKTHVGLKRAYIWLIGYYIGVITGVVGLLSVVASTIHNDPAVRTITIVFGVVCLLPIMALVALACLDDDIIEVELRLWVLGGLFAYSAIAALYSDWILAAVADDNWVGTPAPDNALLYWSYFIAKRLPLLSL